MPRRGENIYKRKDKRWEGRIYSEFTIDGRKKYKSIYGKSYQEVKRLMKAYPTEKLAIKQLKPVTTLNDLAFKWMDKQKLEVKSSTLSTYFYILHAHVLPELGEISLGNMKAETIREFLLQKLETGRMDGTGGLSKKSVKDIQVILNSIFEFGVNEYGYQNPCNTIRNVKAQMPEIDLLAEKERKKITSYIITNLDYKGVGILISMYAGLRLGEVCALRWEHVSFEGPFLHVQYSVNRVINHDPDAKSKTKLIMDTPKSEASNRRIPIPGFLLNDLNRLYKKSEKDCFILTNHRDHFMNPRTYQNYFKTILKNCGVRDMRYHCLRHGFATMCIGLGFDIKTLSEILGHSEVSMTLKRYVHSSAEIKQKQMDKLSELAI